ncbi:sulfatase-like hydrolase/transferase [Aliiroseovarius crassostreae]|uniref:sulfatase-like hydrolase/transferase n=1 Tax=Aliiroseovarius crassostreae TaxID=154981 RepID=UPI0021B036B5|nr:sulfatase-like hydrolase/transferase [Aliiroseovarius crassostreae]UWP87853.1 sulfatase-like hydrolase/transferase [Aliiroseovarius crassostreae]UWQ00473.1 sulfatase-like hydrolase/transferase [Aliiroseovarius crassostreae]
MGKSIFAKFFRAICLILFWGMSFLVVFPFLAYSLGLFSLLPRNAMAVLGVLIVVAILGVAGWSFRQALWFRRPKILPLALLIIGFLLLQPFAFVREAFGEWQMGSLLLTIQENQASTMLNVGIHDFTPQLIKQITYLLLATGAALFLLSSSRTAARQISLVGVVAILSSPVSEYALRLILPVPAHALAVERFLEGHQVTQAPERQKNLVIVYLESLERTYSEIEETRAAYAPFAEFERQGLAFNNIVQVAGTQFTAAGLVATQCGVPLLARGVFHVGRKMKANEDVIPDFTEFLPGVTCLGDILTRDGYNASYVNGSRLTVFSKGALFRSHGYQRVFGLRSYDGWEEESRTNLWGMNDDLLFERVKRELGHLAAQDAPFLLSTLTLSTHGPDALLDGTCPADETALSKLPAAIACSGAHVADLINEIKRLGIWDDTIVLLASDHLAARNTLYDQLSARKEARRNQVTFLNAGSVRQVDRLGSMVDVYPTILELLGYQLQNGTANMGTSLLSDQSNFVETHGVEGFNESIRGNSDMQELLWLAQGTRAASITLD